MQSNAVTETRVASLGSDAPVKFEGCGISMKPTPTDLKLISITVFAGVIIFGCVQGYTHCRVTIRST